jgi:SAM-dependent methyltransferase
MMVDANIECRNWYERSYISAGFSAQRRYPNEELLRFFGRHYFGLSREQRRNIRVLEVGCGSGANLWMVAREGFDAHGIDLSAKGAALCEEMMKQWGVTAMIKTADMMAIPFPDRHFDVVLDVFSSYCLDEASFERYLDEVRRVIKKDGRYFSYTPSKASDAFREPGSARLIDASTLDGIRREDAPYFGSDYPFRFTSPSELASALELRSFKTAYSETVGRTYRGGREYFEFIVIVGQFAAL